MERVDIINDMKSEMKDELQQSTRFSFGSTSAIITNIAIIIGLDTAIHAKMAIIGSLLVIAIADNVSDTLGIHIYQESEGLSQKKVWSLTLSNFLSRLIISLGFVAIIIALPLNIAIIVSLIYGLSILSIVSYLIALSKKRNPFTSIAEHLFISIIIIFISKISGGFIVHYFK
jgi:VIT1/CCC1 family predicted Fe2+/Mn2+ transporter